MMEQILQVPANLDKIETMQNHKLKLIFTTQEDIPSELRSRIMDLHEEFGWLAFLKGHQIDTLDVVAMDIPEKLQEETKSPAQRLRGVLHILWQQQKSTETSEAYYRQTLEKLITHFKEKLV